MKEACQRCGEEDFDRRTLWMACFYEMAELNIPFEKVEKDQRFFYTLRVCKDCRGDWMAAIKSWWDNPSPRQSCGSGIFIREHGRNVEITEEEWYRRNPNREPVRVRKQNETFRPNDS